MDYEKYKNDLRAYNKDIIEEPSLNNERLCKSLNAVEAWKRKKEKEYPLLIIDKHCEGNPEDYIFFAGITAFEVMKEHGKLINSFTLELPCGSLMILRTFLSYNQILIVKKGKENDSYSN